MSGRTSCHLDKMSGTDFGVAKSQGTADRMHELMKFKVSIPYRCHNTHIQYGSGKKKNKKISIRGPILQSRFSAEWFGVNHSE